MENVPFFGNAPDNTHCYQAILRMVLNYFQPDKDYTWEELDKLSDKKEGLWTWPMQGLMNLKSKGFDVVHITDFDYADFAERGVDYLADRYGKEIAAEQEKHSNIPLERDVAKRYLASGINQHRPATWEDILKFLKEKYLICCNVNSKSLSNKPGYIGHFVLIYHADNLSVVFHDPGLPHRPERRETKEQFMKGWAYPDISSCSLQAFRLHPPKPEGRG